MKVRHVNPDGSPKFTNQLIHEVSPYLLQHAHNPVNWHPWNNEAFEIAKRENKPVLLSIGYAACHWCHVMEEESFEDLEIADVINQHYVPIKVDREQRPDVDAVYMSAVQTLTGSGGWPMTVWLKPDQKPYYGGTYFPARDGDRGARIGFLTILKRLHEIYVTEPDETEKQAQQLTEAVRAQHAPGNSHSHGPAGAATLHEAYKTSQGSFDATYGGFGIAPKFPRPVTLEFLFHYGVRTGQQIAIDMVTYTLQKMARGGMYDQLGGGFHRYSVDQFWLIPHFEKMLYDNAQLAITYLEAFQITKDPEFSTVAREILDYVAREMTTPEGGVWSATDADSEGEEGKFFVWSKSEIMEVLGPEDGKVFCEFYGVTDAGNFEGKNILSRTCFADSDELKRTLQRSKDKLYKIRQKRIPPQTDDKIITAWNGLMIGAFARGGFVLSDSKYVASAEKAADFILKHLTVSGRLLRSYRNEKAGVNGFLDDYAFFIFGLLELFEATGSIRWFEKAVELNGILINQFWDQEQGGFFMTGHDHEQLLTREKPYYDGAEPSGNSVAAWNLFRLYSFTSDSKYREYGEKTVQAFNEFLYHASHVAPFMLAALDFQLDRAKEIVLIKGKNENDSTLLDVLRQTFVPNRVIVQVPDGKQDAFEKRIPLVKSRSTIDGKTTAFVCEGATCELPTSDPKIFFKQLSTVEPLE